MGWILFLFFVLVYIVPLGQRPMMIPDEHRYGEIPREMIVSGDWVVPRLNGLLYFEKPVLGYWWHAASLLTFGMNAFAVRFPSAMAVGLTALLVFGLARRRLSAATALLAAAIYLTFGLVYGVGTFAVLDSCFSFLITAMLTAFWVALDSAGRRRTGWLALAGIFCGLAFLTKGFLAFALAAVVLAPFLMWRRDWRALFTAPWLPLGLAAIVILPWAVAVHVQAPDFWNYFFWQEHIRRFAAKEAQHEASIWYFIPVLLGGALPWTVLAPAAIAGLRRRGGRDGLVRYALCWVAGMFLFFSISRGKLGTYILPLFPALAILLAAGLDAYARAGGEKLIRRGAAFFAAVLGLLIIGLPISQLLPFGKDITVFNRDEVWKWLLLIGAAAGWAACCAAVLRAPGFARKMLCFAAGPLAMMLTLPYAIPQSSIANKSPDALYRRNQERVTPQTLLLTSEEPARMACWVFQRTDVYMVHGADELAYGLSQPGAQHRFLTLDQFRALLNRKDRPPLAFIADRHFLESIQPPLPAPKFIDQSATFAYCEW